MGSRQRIETTYRSSFRSNAPMNSCVPSCSSAILLPNATDIPAHRSGPLLSGGTVRQRGYLTDLTPKPVDMYSMGQYFECVPSRCEYFS